MRSFIWLQFQVVLEVLLSASGSEKLHEVSGIIGVPFDNRFFFWRAKKVPWIVAKVLCKADGGTLAVLNSESVNDFILRSFFYESLLKTPQPYKSTTMSAWVNGLKVYHVSNTSKWYWPGEGSFQYSNFGADEGESGWRCLSVKPALKSYPEYDLLWYPTDCLTPLPVLCQFEYIEFNDEHRKDYMKGKASGGQSRTATRKLEHLIMLFILVFIVKP